MSKRLNTPDPIRELFEKTHEDPQLNKRIFKNRDIMNNNLFLPADGTDDFSLIYNIAKEKFNAVPNYISFDHYDKKIKEFLKEKYKLEFYHENGERVYWYFSNETRFICAFKNRLENYDLFIWTNESDPEKIALDFSEFKLKNPKVKDSQIYMLAQSMHGLYLKELSFSAPKIKLDSYYGGGFKEIDKAIKKKIQNENGLFIFHGPPGTGKTSYIKYLAHKCNRNFVFVPNSMIESLIQPSIISILAENPNLVLVLEDAEKVVASREQQENFFASTLLNLTDGIVGTACDLAVIVTFNSSVDEIDPALLRKGRLKYKYEFNKLSIEDSQTLINKFHKEYVVKEPMSLADIFNLEDEIGQVKKKKEYKSIGFGAR